MEYDRKIIHIDMDAFYASVEQRDNPELKGKPVAVGGSPEGRGVVAAASYEARKFGVRSAMSAAKAKRLCPRLVFVRSQFEKYREASRKIHLIFREVTDLVEPLSLDEAYLDVTTNKLNEVSATKLAVYLKSRIKGQVGLTASAGVAPNKFLAKVASDFDKPNGLVVVPPEKIQSFVQCLPVEKLWGVGPATAKRLHSLGISTTEDLRKASPALLSKKLGKLAPFLIELSHGIDHREVTTHRVRKSRGAERTFAKDVSNFGDLEKCIDRLSENIAEVIPRMETKARTVTLKVRYSDFTTLTRSETPRNPIQNALSLSRIAIELLKKTEAGQRPVRLIGVSISNFEEKVASDNRQLNFEFS